MNPEQVKQLIKLRMESMAYPDLMLAWCKEHMGKKLRTNNVPEGVDIRKRCGMTHLDINGWAFLIAYDEKSIVIPSPQGFRDLNPCHYAGAEERNEKRREALGNPDRLLAISEALLRCQRTKQAYDLALNDLDDWIGFPFPDGNILMEAIGLET